MLTIESSEEDFQRLKYEKEMNSSARIRKRCMSVYMKLSSKGLSSKAIGLLLGCCRTSVDRWLHTYDSGGISSLLHEEMHRPCSELEVHRDAIMQNLNENPVHSINEAVERIKQVCGLVRKPTQVRNFLLKNGYRYRKMGQIPGKADIAAQEEWVESLQPYISQARNGECHLLFSDAVHFTLSAFVCMAWSQHRIFLKTASGRNRINVLGAVDAISREVITLDNTSYITAETVMDFLHKIRGRYENKPVVVVMDNARYQHCSLVTNKAKELNIKILFLPPYSPNLNIIERLWKFTKKKLLYGKYYDTPGKFHQAVREFFKKINNNWQKEIESLLTLNFQSLNIENALFVTV